LDAWQQSCAGRAKNVLVSSKDFSDDGVRLQLNGLQISDDFALLFARNELAPRSFAVHEQGLSSLVNL